MEFLDKDLFEKDLQSIALWLNVESVGHVHVKIKKIHIDTFEKQINEMEETYKEFPLEKKRTQKIFDKLNNGEMPQPIYVGKDDPNNFIMEGRHRVVAFKWFGLNEIIVAEVSEQKPELTLESKPPTKFKP
jgi:hypothetical protein